MNNVYIKCQKSDKNLIARDRTSKAIETMITQKPVICIHTQKPFTTSIMIPQNCKEETQKEMKLRS